MSSKHIIAVFEINKIVVMHRQALVDRFMDKTVHPAPNRDLDYSIQTWMKLSLKPKTYVYRIDRTVQNRCNFKGKFEQFSKRI